MKKLLVTLLALGMFLNAGLTFGMDLKTAVNKCKTTANHYYELSKILKSKGYSAAQFHQEARNISTKTITEMCMKYKNPNVCYRVFNSLYRSYDFKAFFAYDRGSEAVKNAVYSECVNKLMRIK